MKIEEGREGRRGKGQNRNEKRINGEQDKEE